MGDEQVGAGKALGEEGQVLVKNETGEYGLHSSLVIEAKLKPEGSYPKWTYIFSCSLG